MRGSIEDLKDFRRLFDRQGPEQHGADGPDGGRGRENADGQREHGDQREARGYHEHPRAVREVLSEAGEWPESAPLPMGFHGLRHASELREGQAARLVGRNASTLEFLGGFGDVRVDFGTQLPFASGVAAKETAQAREKDPQARS